MSKIKTKATGTGMIRMIDKSAVASGRMKNAYQNTKENAETSMYTSKSSPEEYTADHMEDEGRKIAGDAAYVAKDIASLSMRQTTYRGNYEIIDDPDKIKTRAQEDKIKQLPTLDKPGITENGGSPKERKNGTQTRQTIENTGSVQQEYSLTQVSEEKEILNHSRDRFRNKVCTCQKKLESPIYGKQTMKVKTFEKTDIIPTETLPRIKTARKPEKNIRQSAKSMGRVRLKRNQIEGYRLTEKTVKTAEKSSRAAIKTAKKTAKAEEKVAMASATASRKSAQAYRMAIRSATEGAKAAARATAEAVKAIVAATKSLAAWIVGGSGIAICMVIVLCLVGSIAGSAMGVFFSGEENCEEASLRDVVKEINREYFKELDRIGESVQCDRWEVINSEIEWSEILSVYAILTSRKGQEVFTVDDEKAKLLHTLFWQMTEISWETVEVEESDIKPFPPHRPHTISLDLDPTAPPEETELPLITKLVITVEHRTANEMAPIYDYTAEEIDMQRELLNPANKRFWQKIVYGLKFVHINGWVMPLEELSVASPFGFRTHPISGEWKLHAGVDLDAEMGNPIFAIRDGTVHSAGFNESMGNYVIIDHGEGFESESMHMLYSVVHSGETLKAGDIIGYVGSTGASTGPHLHLGVTYNGEYIDPMLLFSQSGSEG